MDKHFPPPKESLPFLVLLLYQPLFIDFGRRIDLIVGITQKAVFYEAKSLVL